MEKLFMKSRSSFLFLTYFLAPSRKQKLILLDLARFPGWGARPKVDMSRPSQSESAYVQTVPDGKCLCPDFRAFFLVSRPCKFERTAPPSCVHLGLDISIFRLGPQPGLTRRCYILQDSYKILTRSYKINFFLPDSYKFNTTLTFSYKILTRITFSYKILSRFIFFLQES